MPDQNVLPLEVTVDDSGLQKLLASLNILTSAMGEKLPSTVNASMKAVESTLSQTSEKIGSTFNTAYKIVENGSHAATTKQKTNEEELTSAIKSENSKRVKDTEESLSKETAASKKHENDSKPKPHEKEGLNIGEVIGIGAAVEGIGLVLEKSKEYAASQHQLVVGTGLAGEALNKAGEDAEKLGDKLGVSGDEAKTAMGKVASYTHATGEELNKQTEAVIAYAQAHGKSAERVAMMMNTAKGQAQVFAEAVGNVGRAQKAALDPAVQAQLAQAKLQDTIGKLANQLLTALGPAITAIVPIIGQLGEIIDSCFLLGQTREKSTFIRGRNS